MSKGLEGTVTSLQEREIKYADMDGSGDRNEGVKQGGRRKRELWQGIHRETAKIK